MNEARVVHLTSVHPSDDARIFGKECIALANAGYQVTLLAPNTADRDEAGVAVRGLPIVPHHRLRRMVLGPWQLLLKALRLEAEIYHFHDPELIPMGVLLRLLGRKVVYDVHEDVPQDILMKRYLPPFLRQVIARIVDRIEQGGVRVFSGVIAATPTIGRKFPAHKTVVVQNFPILDELLVAEPVPYQNRPQEVAYVGSLSQARGALLMLRAIELMGARSCDLRIAGQFNEPDLENLCRAEPGWSRTIYLGRQDRLGVARVLANARAGLAVLQPSTAFFEAYSTKIFEYMATGLPVISSNFALWRRLLEDIRCAIFVDPTDPRAIASAIAWILDHPEEAHAMGERGRRALFTRFNWATEQDKLYDFYERLVRHGA